MKTDDYFMGVNVPNSNERLAKVETKVEGIEAAVSRIEADFGNTSSAISDISVSLAKLSIIAESNQKMEPRITNLEEKVTKYGGGLAVVISVATLLGDEIKALFM